MWDNGLEVCVQRYESRSMWIYNIIDQCPRICYKKWTKKIKIDLKEYFISFLEVFRCTEYETITGLSIFNLFGEILDEICPPHDKLKKWFFSFSMHVWHSTPFYVLPYFSTHLSASKMGSIFKIGQFLWKLDHENHTCTVFRIVQF